MTIASTPLLLCSRPRPEIALLTLNRPAKLNALTYALIDTLAAELRALEADPGVRAVILTGAGRAFSAGADIAEFRTSLLAGGEEAVRDFCRRGQRLTAAIEGFAKPILAAVNGIAYGGGCEIVEATHITIAADDAVFAKPEIALGIIPTFGGTQRLSRVAGRKRALHAILTGEPFDAATAAAHGLVNEVVPAAELLDAAVRTAEQILRHSDGAIRAALGAVTRGLNVSIDEGLAIEAMQFALTASGTDWDGGTERFLARRTGGRGDARTG